MAQAMCAGCSRVTPSFIASFNDLGQKSRAASCAVPSNQGVRFSVSEHYLFAAITALVCLPLSLALAAAGLPVTSAVLLVNPPKRVKVFRDKYGQQTATLCLVSGLVAALGLGGGGAAIQLNFPAVASFWLDWPLPTGPLAAALVLAAGLALVYRAAWQSLKDNRLAHAIIGCSATLAAWGFGYLFVAFLRHFTLSAVEPGWDPAFFLPPLNSASWPLLVLCTALSLALAGAYATLYLIYRRDKDDFGRDYYNFALKLASKWALFSTLAALAASAGLFALIWPVVRDLPVRPAFFWGEGLALVSFFMACTLWALVIRNQNPLRLKLHCITACLLAFTGLAGLMFASFKYFFG